MKAMLLRVGIDTGTDGALAPVFDDGTFEYIPLSEYDHKTKENRTYRNTIGRSGKPLAYYLPSGISDRKMHFDPEFETFTYGDPTVKRNYLLKLEKGDLLVFYAGLVPHQTAHHKKGLYVIGYFIVDRIFDFNSLDEGEMTRACELCSNNAHVKRDDVSNLVIVTGNPEKSRLLDSAVLISEPKLDKRGVPYHAVSRMLEERLGISGSIQRSIPPRFVEGEKNLANLNKLLC